MLDSRLRVKRASLFRELTGFFLHPLFHRLFLGDLEFRRIFPHGLNDVVEHDRP